MKNTTIMQALVFIMLFIMITLLVIQMFPLIKPTAINMTIAQDECLKLGGNIERNLLGFSCSDIDEEDYLFYWHKAKDGSYYKTR